MSGTNSDFTFDFSQFLPAVNQTSTLVKFFGATVNQLFQPGTSKTVSGYIGEVPNYNNYLTDFYVQEPDSERGAYQLEPSMVSFNLSTTTAPTVSNSLTYPDFVAYLMNSSANVNFQPRLFETNYFTWAPPIDIDKLMNFGQYVWVGQVGENLELNRSTLPVLTVTAPVAVYTAAADQKLFAGTGLMTGFPTNPAAYVNGTKVNASYNSTTNMFTLSKPTNAYDSVVVTLYNNLYNEIVSLASLDLSPVSNYYVQYTGDGFTTTFNAFSNVTVAGNATVVAVYLNGNLQGYSNNSGFVDTGVTFAIDNGENPPVVTFATAPNGVTSEAVADVVTIVTYNGLSAITNNVPPSSLVTNGIAVLQPSLTSGIILELVDANSFFHNSYSTYFVDGVGVAARLTNINDMIFVTNPQYQTIDRSSLDQNAWSLHNFWVHKDSYAWSGSDDNFIVNQATRPIIEFVKDMVLFNYGNQRVEVDAMMPLLMANYTVQGNTTPITLGQINYKPIGSVSVNQGVDNQNNSENIVLLPGMSFLVINGNVNQLFTVSNDGNGNLLLTPDDNSVKGQYFTSPTVSQFNGQDIHYNGTIWVAGNNQQWSESEPPLFYLYNADATGIPLDDPSMYPGSNFIGSEIFTYATGTGATDTVLLQPLQYDANGYIVFENKTTTKTYTYNGGLITGLYCYGVYARETNAEVFENCSAIDTTDADIIVYGQNQMLDIGHGHHTGMIMMPTAQVGDSPQSGTLSINGTDTTPGNAEANGSFGPFSDNSFAIDLNVVFGSLEGALPGGAECTLQFQSPSGQIEDNWSLISLSCGYSDPDYPTGKGIISFPSSSGITGNTVFAMDGPTQQDAQPGTYGVASIYGSMTNLAWGGTPGSSDVIGTIVVNTNEGICTYEGVIVPTGGDLIVPPDSLYVLQSWELVGGVLFGTDVVYSVSASQGDGQYDKYASNSDTLSAQDMSNGVIPGIPLNEVMDSTDFVDATGGSAPSQTVSYYYKTYSLWLPAPNPTQQVLGSSFPGIPPNLQANPLAEDVSFISLSDWYGQFTEILENQTNFSGNTFAANNYRDTSRNLALGVEIVQHQAPMLKSMLVSSAEQFDIPNSVFFAETEYKKFKNKFALKIVDLATRGVLDNDITDVTQNPNDPANWATTPLTWVITALNQIKANYNSSFPFSLSTMAGGNYFIPPTPAFLGIMPPTTPMFVIDNTFSKQPCLLRCHDGSYLPAFGTFTLTSGNYYVSSDWRDEIFLALETLIYQNIPNILSNSGNVPSYIQERLNFDVYQWMDNVFYTTPVSNGYSRTEINAILISSFEQWLQQGRFDYRTYGGYDQGNPFTWNYSSSVDKFGNPLPGNWRAIYQWYFDTDHPHTRPWEMLGFAEMPNWWIDAYGTNYGSSNKALWRDLENGFIAEGPRLGNHARYARPGLHSVIPVDAYGNLLDPIAAGIVPSRPTQAAATADWVFGDWGPVETQWRNSSSYKFALSELGFLIKPPRFTEICWDTQNYGFSGEQWVDFRTLNRPSAATDLIHGELDASGNPTVVIGVQQWLVDNLVNVGQSASVLGNAIRNLDVRLAHRMAGFVSSDGLQVVSDTFGLLPTEDVQISLYNAPAFDTETYTGVLIEWTGKGYRVTGYDNRNAYFTIFPPNTSGPKGVISISDTPEQIPYTWRQNTYYTVNVKVIYQDSVYQCTKSHTSGPTFDLSYWTLLGKQPPVAPRVVSYAMYSSTAVQIPYSTVLPNLQAVSDFLLGLQAWQISRGWLFDQIDSSSGFTRDWTLAVKEFLEWSQVSWAPGNFIALSPGAEALNFVSSYGTVLNVEDAITGFFGLLDRSGNPISSRNAFISRLGSQITLQSTSADIYAARLRVAEVEHILVFSNTTIFDDILYIPLFNLRQARLKLIANTSSNWNGRLNAPGFVLVGNDLVPNFEKNAEDIRTMFDIEKTDRTDFLSYARHNIGYQARSYMQDLLLSQTEQFEFFQGMIQAKGSPSVFERLLRSTRINENSDIEFLEEWAVRQCHFGAPFNPRITMTLPQNDVRCDPQLIIFEGIENALPVWIEVPTSPLDSRWLDAPATQDFFPISTRAPVLPSAGPVRINEVQYTSFYPSDLQGYFETAYYSNLSVFNEAERVWIYNNNGQWDVWRVWEIGAVPNPITEITVPSDDPTVVGMRISFQYPLTLTTNDVGAYIVIDNSTMSTPDLLGIQVITAIDLAGQWIEVDQTGSTGYVFTGTTVQPTARIFRSTRFANNADLNATIVYSVNEVMNANEFADSFDFDALDDSVYDVGNVIDNVDVISGADTSYWIVGDLVWVDNDSGTGLYTVRQWDGTTFNIVRNQPVRVDPGSISNSTVYEAGSQIVNSYVLSGQQSNSNARLVSDQPLVDNMAIIDPIAGYIAGIAEREIEYRTDIDPAQYGLNPWGANQVGQVWWDLSTCRYIDPYTDILGAGNDRDIAEISYRSQNWAMIAPNTSIDVYEWVQSSVSPLEWASAAANDTAGTYSGTVYNGATPSYVQQSIYSADYGTLVPVYYFWVRGRTIVPNVPFRNTDVATVISILTNPSTTGTPWIAPIMPNGLLISGVQPYLDNLSSTLMVETESGSQDKPHAEWVLIDQNDSLSLPPVWMWRKMRDSLGGFEDDLKPLPYASLSTYRSTGIYQGQNMFTIGDETAGAPQGILDARESYIGIINNILARSPIAVTNASGVASLNRSDTSTSEANQYLYWSRPDTSWLITPPPSNEYTVTVYSSDERNLLLLTAEFQDAIDSNSAPIRILIDGTNTEYPFWSIWVFDPAQVNLFLQGKPSGDDALTYLYDNAESIFSLATAYEVVCDTFANMLAGIYVSGTIATGARIFVNADETADGFWTIYVYNGGETDAASSYAVHRAQLYRTNDFIEVVPWYAQGISISGNTINYAASNPPTVSYASTALRDQNEGTQNSYTLPQNLFVAITAAGASNFTWYAFDTTVVGTIVVNGVTRQVYAGWTTVASSNGTIALTGAFYEQFSVNGNYFDRFVYGLSTPPVLSETLRVNGIPSPVPVVVNRDGSWEIRVLVNALNANVLNDAQMNEVFFSMIHFVHTQQNSVDWIFKTSFMTIGGFAIPLTQTGIVLEDPTTDLVEYVDEVKPYRVKVRDYSQQYSLGIDRANVTATDFDLPVYFDTTLNAYTSLYGTVTFNTELVNGVETQVPSFTLLHGDPAQFSQYPWQDWYDNFLTSDKIRSITIKLLFDRVVGEGYSGYDIPPYSTEGFDSGDQYGTVFLPWVAGAAYTIGQQVNYNNNNYQCVTANDSPTFITSDWTLLDSSQVNETAAYRIANYYDGTAINAVLSFSYGAPDVMNIRQKGNLIDGTQYSYGDFDAEPLDTEGFDSTEESAQTSVIDGGAFPWIAGFNYVVGALVQYQNSTYQCTVANNDLTFNTDKWSLIGAVEVSINAPTSDAYRAISDTQTVILPNGSTATIPLGGVADPLGNGLRDPYIGADIPEERVPLVVDDTMLMRVTTRAVAGAPIQSAKVYDVSESNAIGPLIFPFDVIPESAESVLVFRDGLLASNGTDYTVDQLGRTASVNIITGPTRYHTIYVHAFGAGSNLPLNGQFFLSAATSEPRTYELNVITPISSAAQLGVTVAGVRTTAFSVGSDNASIMFNNSPSQGSDIVVNQYQVSEVNEGTLINVQTLRYVANKSWKLKFNDTETFPAYAGLMVFVNGLRLNPPQISYGTFTSAESAITLNAPPGQSKSSVYWTATGATWASGTEYVLNDIVNFQGQNYTCITANSDLVFNISHWAVENPTLYTAAIPTISELQQTAGSIDDPQFAFLVNSGGAWLVSQNSNFISNNVSVTIFNGNQYTLNGSNLKITSSVSPSDVIQVINFQNSMTMGTQTYVFTPQSNGTYPLISLPPTNEYAFVSYNGLMLSPDADYNFEVDENGNPFVSVPSVTEGSDFLVVTIHPLQPYRGEMNWLTTTNTPSAIRMMPERWDNLSTAEKGSVDETFYFGGNFNNNFSFINLNGIIPNADSVYSITVNSEAYTTPVPILTALPIKNAGEPNDPQLAFLGSSLISQNYNFVANASTNGSVSPAVTIEIQDVPVNIFADLDGWAGLVPYYPLDENPYDHAVVNQAGVPQPEFVYTMVDWDKTRTDYLNTAVLVDDLLLTDTSITLNLDQANVSPKIGLQYPFFVPTNEQAGVIWVNAERIEYGSIVYGDYVSVPGFEIYDTGIPMYEPVPTTAVLSNLRRSTQGTAIPENRIVVTSPYPLVQPYQTVFTLNTGSINMAANGLVQVMMQTSNGRNISVPSTDYSVSANTETGVVVVTLNSATDNFYIVSITLPLSHSIGSKVYNGNQVFEADLPIGPPSGDRYLEPINYIVNKW